jgi:hypothetical protein
MTEITPDEEDQGALAGEAVMPGNGGALSLVPDEPDQVPRLKHFRAEHPEVIILLQGAMPKAWVGGRKITRPTLRGLLDELDEIFAADNGGNQRRPGLEQDFSATAEAGRFQWHESDELADPVDDRRRQAGHRPASPDHHQSGGVMFYGRSEADWRQLVAEGQDHLEDLAAHRADTTYGEMNTELSRRTGLRPFDLDQAQERKAMGELLGEISDASYEENGVLISALVHHQDGGPGGGFYDFAERKGLIPAGLRQLARWEWWIGHVTAVHNAYSRKRA